MRKELKPNLEFAEGIFPKVNELIKNAFVYLHKEYLVLIYDPDNSKLTTPGKIKISKLKYNITKRLESKTFLNIENELSDITLKDMGYYHNIDFWFLAGEPQAFILSVPDPVIINDITKDELTEIVTKIWKRGFLEKDDSKYIIGEYGYHLINYYKKLLEINFGNYSLEIIDKYDWRFSRSISENISDTVEEIFSRRKN